MAKYSAEFGNDVLKEMERVHRDSKKIFGAMTKAGAEVTASNVKKNCPVSGLQDHVAITKTYETPTDDGINTKVYFKGYMPFKGGRRKFVRRGKAGSDKYETTEGVPAAFVAQVTEYGTSERLTDLGDSRGVITKRPFFRKSFKKQDIERAMLDAQRKESGGILDE